MSVPVQTEGSRIGWVGSLLGYEMLHFFQYGGFTVNREGAGEGSCRNSKKGHSNVKRGKLDPTMCSAFVCFVSL